MRLSLVTETFAPEINGVAMTLERIARGVCQNGHEMEIIRPHPEGKKPPPADAPWEEFRVPGAPIPGYPELRFGFPFIWLLEKQWVQKRPDVIHIATEGPLGLVAMAGARRLGIPYFSSFHTNFHAYGEHYGLGLFREAGLAYLKWFHNETSMTLAPSNDLIQELVQEGFQRTDLLDRGVEAQLFSPERRDPELRKSWGVTDDDPVVIYVGRLAGEKNLPLVAKAFLKFQAKHPSAKWVLVGDGPLRSKLEKEFPEAVFCGMKTGEDLARHYASGDVFIFGSTTETFGNVVTEALASGLIVLAYNYAAPARFIRDGQNGFLAPYNDEAAFLDKAALNGNSNTWSSIREKARETAQSLSWSQVVARYLKAAEFTVKGEAL